MSLSVLLYFWMGTVIAIWCYGIGIRSDMEETSEKVLFIESLNNNERFKLSPIYQCVIDNA